MPISKIDCLYVLYTLLRYQNMRRFSKGGYRIIEANGLRRSSNEVRCLVLKEGRRAKQRAPFVCSFVIGER